MYVARSFMLRAMLLVYAALKLCTDFSKNKKWHRSRFEPMILCILTSRLDHYTTSVLVKMVIVALYIYCFYRMAGPSQGQLWSSPLGGGNVAALWAGIYMLRMAMPGGDMYSVR